jgi:regulator of sigma D
MGMSKMTKNTQERRGSSTKLIANMLAERKQLLGLLLQASNMSRENTDELDHDLLDEFCQMLVDYIAAGHFGLYERIVEGTERRKSVAKLAVNLYPLIDEATQIALVFNEKYSADRMNIDLKQLHKDLSVLGESLTSRIDYEDQLIQKLSEIK